MGGRKKQKYRNQRKVQPQKTLNQNLPAKRAKKARFPVFGVKKAILATLTIADTKLLMIADTKVCYLFCLYSYNWLTMYVINYQYLIQDKNTCLKDHSNDLFIKLHVCRYFMLNKEVLSIWNPCCVCSVPSDVDAKILLDSSRQHLSLYSICHSKVGFKDIFC